MLFTDYSAKKTSWQTYSSAGEIIDTGGLKELQVVLSDSFPLVMHRAGIVLAALAFPQKTTAPSTDVVDRFDNVVK